MTLTGDVCRLRAHSIFECQATTQTPKYRCSSDLDRVESRVTAEIPCPFQRSRRERGPEFLPVSRSLPGLPIGCEPWQKLDGDPSLHSIIAGTSKYLKADDIASGRANITVMLTVRKFRLDAIEVDRCRKGRGALAVMRSEFQCLTSRGWKVAIRGPVATHCAGAVAGNVTRLWDLL